jgi:hypothetical protein
MKYIKKINEFYYKEGKVSEVIDDILLEINDMPYFTAISWSIPDNTEVVVVKFDEDLVNRIESSVDIDEEFEEFLWHVFGGVKLDKDIKETIKRLLDFMTESGYNHVMEIGTDDIAPGDQNVSDYNRVFEFEELDDDDLTLWPNEYIRLDFTK